jgi:hypothetical protein
MLKGSRRQSSECKEGKHDRQSLLKGKKCKNMKNPFTFYDKEKSQRKTHGKQANSKGLITRTFLHVLLPGGGLFQHFIHQVLIILNIA